MGFLFQSRFPIDGDPAPMDFDPEDFRVSRQLARSLEGFVKYGYEAEIR